MPTYDFYQNTYLGSSIPESCFPQLIARAEAWLSKLERTCQVECPGPDSRAMALCAAAEALLARQKRGGVAQTTIGGVTVRYEESDCGLQRQLLQNAGVYLDICRGVG